MAYTEQEVSELVCKQQAVTRELQELSWQTIEQGNESDHAGVREHLLHGVSRRIDVLRRAIENIYREFPPCTSHLLEWKALHDVQINLHAFVINLYGIFDNWAWAFVFRHGLEEKVGGRQKVGLFSEGTTKYLPPTLEGYLSTSSFQEWLKYIKSFRHALAHRIPLYIPPYEVMPEDKERYKRLEAEKETSIRQMQLERFDKIQQEQDTLGRPSFMFLHSFVEDKSPQPVFFHPQLLADARLVVEFGSLFLKHWHERA